MMPSSDKEFQRYKNFDFSGAKRAKETPHLVQLQAGQRLAKKSALPRRRRRAV